jgi:hypothetical protein
MLLACTDLDAADTARGQLGITVLAADMPETSRLWETNDQLARFSTGLTYSLIGI